jgi:hypothetical protein
MVIFSLRRGLHTLSAHTDIKEARGNLYTANDTIRRNEHMKPSASPCHIHYIGVPAGVIRHEDLFDQPLTERLIALLKAKESLHTIIEDHIITCMSVESEISLLKTWELIETLDDKDKLEGISIRRICVSMVQAYLTELYEEWVKGLME